jgi:hypothetical protein
MVMRLASTPETALPKVFATMIEFKKCTYEYSLFYKGFDEGVKFFYSHIAPLGQFMSIYHRIGLIFLTQIRMEKDADLFFLICGSFLLKTGQH